MDKTFDLLRHLRLAASFRNVVQNASSTKCPLLDADKLSGLAAWAANDLSESKICKAANKSQTQQPNLSRITWFHTYMHSTQHVSYTCQCNPAAMLQCPRALLHWCLEANQRIKGSKLQAILPVQLASLSQSPCWLTARNLVNWKLEEEKN